MVGKARLGVLRPAVAVRVSGSGSGSGTGAELVGSGSGRACQSVTAPSAHKNRAVSRRRRRQTAQNAREPLAESEEGKSKPLVVTFLLRAAVFGSPLGCIRSRLY